MCSSDLDKGVFVQGVFRSNMAIMGLAFVQNAYGNAGLPSGAVYVGVVTLLYNVLSVITLSRSGARAGRRRWLHIGRNIVTNPLIVAIHYIAEMVYINYIAFYPLSTYLRDKVADI